MEPRTCVVCGEPFVAARPEARFCGPTCRKRSSRNPELYASPSVPPPGPVTVEGESIEAATRAELDAGGRAETSLGRIALQLARRLDENRRESGMGVAAVVREHSRVLAEALKGAEVQADAVDELRAKRDRKRATG